MNEIKNREVKDILLVTMFPKTAVQLCSVHMVCNSVQFVPYKDRKAVPAGLKTIYRLLGKITRAHAVDCFIGSDFGAGVEKEGGRHIFLTFCKLCKKITFFTKTKDSPLDFFSHFCKNTISR